MSTPAKNNASSIDAAIGTLSSADIVRLLCVWVTMTCGVSALPGELKTFRFDMDVDADLDRFALLALRLHEDQMIDLNILSYCLGIASDHYSRSGPFASQFADVSAKIKQFPPERADDPALRKLISERDLLDWKQSMDKVRGWGSGAVASLMQSSRGNFDASSKEGNWMLLRAWFNYSLLARDLTKAQVDKLEQDESKILAMYRLLTDAEKTSARKNLADLLAG